MMLSKGTGLKRPCCIETRALGPSLDDVLGGAVPEVARVLHVERDGVGAAHLVADVLRHDRRLDAQLREPPADARLADVAEADLVEAQVPVLVALGGRQLGDVLGGDDLGQTLGEDGHAVGSPAGEALHDRADERVDDGATGARCGRGTPRG